MTRIANRFTNPATGAFFDWPVNHDTESSVAKSRQMADGATTDNIGLIPQQGAPTPLILAWKGRFFDPDQLTQFMVFWRLCENQTIILRDIAGDQYEILITDFSPTRVAVSRNPRFPDLTWIWSYDITMRVLRALTGPWEGSA